MLKDKKLSDYADLVLEIGVNLQEGQGLEISCPVESREVAIALTESAYRHGAKLVRVRWNDEIIERINFLNAQTEALTEIPKWLVDSRNYLIEKNYCYVAISAEDPNAFVGVPASKLGEVAKAKSKALKKFSDCVMANGIRWCVVSVPTEKWAKQVFPDAENPMENLSTAIEKSMRLDCSDPVSSWKEHVARLDRRAEYLNFKRFEYLHFTSANGTDLKVGLAQQHVWLSAKEKAKDGVSFIANLPTEEIFTAPHKDKVNGIVKSAMPLIYNGQTIDKFSLTFKNGKVVSYSAEIGQDALGELIKTDSGTCRIGEVALIGKNSPIAKSNILFYNTLFDENASCHLALGKAYPTTIKDGELLSLKDLKALGANDSVEHVDFMIGSQDMNIIGINSDGEETILFYDGDWVF